MVGLYHVVLSAVEVISDGVFGAIDHFSLISRRVSHSKRIPLEPRRIPTDISKAPTRIAHRRKVFFEAVLPRRVHLRSKRIFDFHIVGVHIGLLVEAGVVGVDRVVCHRPRSEVVLFLIETLTGVRSRRISEALFEAHSAHVHIVGVARQLSVNSTFVHHVRRVLRPETVRALLRVHGFPLEISAWRSRLSQFLFHVVQFHQKVHTAVLLEIISLKNWRWIFLKITKKTTLHFGWDRNSALCCCVDFLIVLPLKEGFPSTC